MSPSPPHTCAPDWQLRVIDPVNGILLGAAVQVAPSHAVTCAHVVLRAVANAGPGSTVHLDAPRGGGTWTASGTVAEEGWWWENVAPWDVAVLRLDRPGPGTPAVLAPPHRAGDSVRVVGFPQSPAGRWVTGRLVGEGGRHHEFTQLDTDSAAGQVVSQGFSGSGVRPINGDRLLGIVTEKAVGGRIGWMIPMAAVPRVWPSGPQSGVSPALAPGRAVAETARAMAELPTLLDPDLRFAFYRGLDPRLRRRLRTDQDLEAFASLLVSFAYEQFCLLDDVLAQLEHWEEGSAAMRRVREAAASLTHGP